MASSVFCQTSDVLEIAQPSLGDYPDTPNNGTPSKAQVESLIQKIGSDVALCIARAGYVQPISNDDALEWLKMVNATGAAALAVLVVQGYGNPDEDTLYDKLWAMYRGYREEILTGTAPLGPVATESNKPASLWTSNDMRESTDELSSIEPAVRLDTQF